MEREGEMKVLGRTSKHYQAAMHREWEKLAEYCNEIGTAGFPITIAGNTALHIAVYSESVDLVTRLLQITPIQVTNNRGDTILHEVAGLGNIAMAHFLLENEPALLNAKNKIDETPLFRAAVFGRTEMVDFLAQKAREGDTPMSNHTSRGGTSILHIAILSRYFDTALQVLQIDPSLQYLRDQSGMTCLQLLANMPSAFKSGFPMGKLTRLLYLCLPDDDDDDLEDDKPDETDPIPPSETEDLEGGCGRNCSRQFSYWIVYSTAISRIYSALWGCIAQGSPGIKRLWDIKKQHTRAVKLAKCLAKNEYDTFTSTNLGDRPRDIFIFCKEDMGDIPHDIDIYVNRKEDMDDQDEETDKPGDRSRDFSVARNVDIDDKVEETDEPGDMHPPPISSSESPLLSAARNGIIEIVEVILKLYPEAIEVINERHENILHLAVRYRRKQIMELLQNWPGPTSRLRRRINCDYDSILHQAAYLSARQLRDRPGEALRMQSEIQWFERVRKIVPPYFINHRNNNSQTADELFISQHKELMRDGRKWIDQTTKACTIVAVLIATVAFTSAYTTPGGSNSKTGHPVLLKETPFHTFTISDTLSLCFSLTSVVLFLSIMTSKMDQEDFRRSLPLKLVLGLTTLFLAVAAMMVAFAATLVLMVGKRLHSAATPVYTIACCPVALFLVLEFPLYVNIAWYTLRDMRQSFIDSLPLGKRIRSSVQY